MDKIPWILVGSRPAVCLAAHAESARNFDQFVSNMRLLVGINDLAIPDDTLAELTLAGLPYYKQVLVFMIVDEVHG